MPIKSSCGQWDNLFVVSPGGNGAWEKVALVKQKENVNLRHPEKEQYWRGWKPEQLGTKVTFVSMFVKHGKRPNKFFIEIDRSSAHGVSLELP